jgi:hypothetical protein
MLSHKRLSLLLAATVFASLVVVIIATTYGEGQTTPISINAGLQPDICCPGTSCTWAKQTFSRCYCSDINADTIAKPLSFADLRPKHETEQYELPVRT